MSLVRARFAPSPTGRMHLGGLRTALFNYLLARRCEKEGGEGKFILRIEDTDQNRLVPGSADEIEDILAWARIPYDEGPRKNGGFGPYIQSQRSALYREHADLLIDRGHAYRCFCTPERIEEMRQYSQKKGTAFRYDRFCLSMKPSEIAARLRDGVSHTVRLKMPDHEIAVDDVVRGRVAFPPSGFDDSVLLKSDGLPTYHLANVVDDHLMQITHVIRGEEWLPSCAKHAALYSGFGWKMPTLAHLPLLLNPNGEKLSKRNKDAAAGYYREQGFLPEAVVNFVALLGWGPGDEKEIMSMDELISKFSLERVNKSGAVVSMDKLRFISSHFLRSHDEGAVAALLRSQLANATPQFQFETEPSDAYLQQVIHLIKGRVSSVGDIVTLCRYFFEDPSHTSDETRIAAAKMIHKGADAVVDFVLEQLQTSTEPLSAEAADAILVQAEKAAGVKKKVVLGSLRIALTGTSVGASVGATMSVIGRDACCRRLNAARAVGLEALAAQPLPPTPPPSDHE